MTTETTATDFSMADRPPSPEDEDDAFWRSQVILDADDEKAGADLYPRLFNISTGMIYTAVLRTQDPEPAEYVTIPFSPGWGDEENRLHMAVTRWNMQWEAAQFRRWIFREDDLPSPLCELAGRGDFNIVLVPRTSTRYFEYAPLLHMLPRAVLERHGLPLLHAGQWPPFADFYQVDRYLPDDFESRLSRAWASTIWGHIFRKSPMSGLTTSDPIRLLAHNLDYWVPAVTHVIQQEMREWPEVDKGIVAHPVRLTDGTIFGGAVRANPRMGGDVWRGEDEAALMVERTIEAADTHGRFREILDAVRSNRVEEDFPDRWSCAREDFERKLYHKRLKIKVRFVELTDTIPVQGPETEVVGSTVTSDFLALLDERDRQVVVLLSSGVTKLAEVADILGYRNHSPVSKRLDRIRKQAALFFGAC